MAVRSGTRRGSLIVALLLVGILYMAAPAGAAPAAQPRQTEGLTPAPTPGALQAAFTAAAREFGVPERVLLAVSYNLSRWDAHAGAPSVAGGYGPMHLVHVDRMPNFDARGDDRPARVAVPDAAALHTLDAAAALLGLDPNLLKRDPAQNIRGGAALLAQYAHANGAAAPTNEADWYSAVAAYSHASDPATAADFADSVYATMQQGVSRTTADGQAVTLTPASVVPNRPAALDAAKRQRQPRDVECPKRLDCEFVPAAYMLNNTDDLGDYGNYDLANRPADGLDVRYIVIHDTEVDFATTLQLFQNSRSYVSTHYVVHSSDGHIAQMVATKNVAWHAGNWYVNGHSIGIEHEGFAIAGAAWYTENMYRSSAKLVRYLARKYDIPLDRAHIIGHDDIPYPTQAQFLMHWDPGPFWDWAHYMDLLGRSIEGKDDRRDGTRGIVTIAPNFATNIQTVTDCEGGSAVAAQAANFVYLRTAPNLDAPYVVNPYLSEDPICANNWGDKAVTGQSFYRFARQGSWDGIYFGGQQAWYYNPGRKNTVRSKGILITPKAGLASIPVYGRAYPEAAAYPAEITPQDVVPIGLYSIPAGQIYVASGKFKSDYYSAPTYAPMLEGSDHVVVEGQTEYYQIFFNHRFAFVMASDVDIVRR
jgi:N-acetyl-anhydromuramyl-L-alanine amidase AmpD